MVNCMGLTVFYLVFHFAVLAVKAKLPDEKLFRTLECNAGLADEECVSWKETFGDTFTHTEEVSIPCGKCVNLDVGGDILSLTGGLSVVGKLVMATPIDIETPYVIVQGELLLNSDKIWDGTQDITITLTGTATQTFLPADNNANVCGGNPCGVGKKPFAIAGGKLLVNGMPSFDYDTPTWLHIQDVKADQSGSGSSVDPVEAYPGLVNVTGCSVDGKFIVEDFSTPSQPTSAYEVESTIGSVFEYTETSLKVSGRRHKAQGPIFDLVGMMKCIKPDVRYQVNARLKTYREEVGPDQPEDSDCRTDGSGCLDILFKWKPRDSYERKEYAYHEEAIHNWKNGEEVCDTRQQGRSDYYFSSLREDSVYRVLNSPILSPFP